MPHPLYGKQKRNVVKTKKILKGTVYHSSVLQQIYHHIMVVSSPNMVMVVVHSFIHSHSFWQVQSCKVVIISSSSSEFSRIFP